MATPDEHSQLDQYIWWMLKFLNSEMQLHGIDAWDESSIVLDSERLLLPLVGTQLSPSEKLRILEELELQGAIKVKKSAPGTSQLEIAFMSPWSSDPEDNDEWFCFNPMYFKYAEKFSSDERTRDALKFDKDLSLLTIGESKIKIKKDSDQYVFLKILFEGNPFEAVQFSELLEKFDDELYDDKKFYNAAYNVNQKIKQETKIRDFFIATRHSVQVNPRYKPD